MSFIRKIKRGNKVYLAEVENKRIAGKVVQRHIRYVGKQRDDKNIIITPLSDVSIEQVKLCGPLLVLDHLAKAIKLPEVLGSFAPEILSLVYAHCIDYQSVNKMERWFARTDLNMILGLDSVTEARLLSAMDSLEELDAVALQRRIFQNTSECYDLGNQGVVYDVTNTYFTGRQCPLGKYGKDKEGVKGRPLIQIGLGVTRKYAVPVFHQVHDGNIHDSRMFQDAITAFRLYGIKNVLVVFDRGISSKKNQSDIKQLQWNVLCGLPLNDELKDRLRDLRREYDLVHFKHRVCLNDSVFYVHLIPHSIGNVKGHLAFCINDRRRFEARESRYRNIAEAQSLLENGNPIRDNLRRFFGSDGRVLSHKVSAAEEFDGCSCIFTTTRMTKEEMVEKYFDKDIVEKAFHEFKSTIKLRPVRHWLEHRVKTHVFLCYLSYLLLSLLNIHVRPLGLSATAALEELESMYKVYLKDHRRKLSASRIVALTKKQEEIIRAVDKRLLKDCNQPL